LLASVAAAEATLALAPLLEALPDELEFEEPELEELLELLADDVVLLPPEEPDTLDDEVPEVAALVLPIDPPPQPHKLRKAAATAAVSSGESWGDGMCPEHSLFEMEFT
jgi:hypothetical protein